MNFSRLVNKNKQTLARLQESPRLLLHRKTARIWSSPPRRHQQDQTVVSAASPGCWPGAPRSTSLVARGATGAVTYVGSGTGTGSQLSPPWPGRR
ncbi:hypothetical protein SHIRM173S_01238 [Streptomyces hirsutus]